MSLIWKTEFSEELKISTIKLDSLMRELNLEYTYNPRDKKMKVVSDEAQDKIKEYLWIDT